MNIADRGSNKCFRWGHSPTATQLKNKTDSSPHHHLSPFTRMLHPSLISVQVVSVPLTRLSPWASCCAWCRTAGVWGCSPCCGTPADGWSADTSAWPGPSGRRWPEPPPEDPSPLSGAWATTWPRRRGDAWCAWRLLPPPPPTWRVRESDQRRLYSVLSTEFYKFWCETQNESRSAGFWPGLAFAEPAIHLRLLVVKLVVGVVSPPGSRCDHGPGLTRGVVGGVLYKTSEKN